MTTIPESRLDFDSQAAYQIVVEGTIADSFVDRLDGMVISHPIQDGRRPITILTGNLVDQAALNGILNTIYGLHQSIISVQRLGINKDGQ